jgi:hypothetical protein
MLEGSVMSSSTAHARICGQRGFQMSLATPGDDDLVAASVQRFGQSAPDARAAAGDEDGIAGEFHDLQAIGWRRRVRVASVGRSGRGL